MFTLSCPGLCKAEIKLLLLSGDAVAILKSCLAKREQQDHGQMELATNFVRLAQVLIEMNTAKGMADAQDLLQRALTTRERHLGTHHPEVAVVLSGVRADPHYTLSRKGCYIAGLLSSLASC